MLQQEPVQANDKKGKKNKNKNKEKSPDDSHSPLPASPGVYAPPAQTNGDHQVEEPEGVQLPVEQLELKSEVEPGNAILNDFKQDLGVRASRPPETRTTSAFPSLEEQVHLLSLKEGEHQRPSGRASDAVLFSPGLETVGYETPAQYALLGHLPGADGAAAGADPRVMLNTNVPFSAFICGLQGSGKSHTTSCIIENCSFGLEALGRLQKPLSTLVLQFNEYSSHGSSQPSEAAFLASVLAEYSADVRSIPVTVLVSPSNYHPLRQMYSQIPNVQVRPFRLQPRHLNISTMLALMSLGRKDAMPLYMAQVTKLLRQMAMESTSGAFDYLAFRRRLTGLHLDRSQTPFLDQRLDLLDSFLDLEPRTAASPPGDYFVDGGITILDLSCPFMDESTACILFRIAIDLFLHAHPSRGKMIVADEAHKYMTDTPAGHALTETFMTVMRQQRHLGVRLIVSTQEPTISPRLIDLCSITIVHRFSSPEWYQTIQKHIAVESDDDPSPSSPSDGLARISRLRTGEALVFAPSAVLREGDTDIKDVRQRTFKMMVRKRITWDGGQTIVCIR
ncbi:hypothetical protein ASPZODRAFT_136064 [Penicilliopsis zonata CBS 506.65]|uniref:Zona occludens toxin N-terminal domain-containing protein n=1 Tax=Penicilliopsis zonata CBS 506.65 TaxID=1073090 RepID=A0A1L9S8X5_9EURO|nr:hypothetical protein ASPZODRAFT_136064 [Penicilliopsis zonata CBS 506.65]OJJ43611.1 hypothetical protein ASPZODRAFT_136064 [Penicilliopsis zonata CBS 506.65]